MSDLSPLRVTGRAWLFAHDGLNTDDMYPAHAMKLDLPEAAREVFHAVRPGWTDQVRRGDVVVAGANFGVGSSRPVSALMKQLGVAALVAEEFNSLFRRNCINDGLPAMAVPGATTLFAEGEVATIDVERGTWRNDTSGAEGTIRPPAPLILDILRSGGIMPRLREQGFLPEPASRA